MSIFKRNIGAHKEKMLLTTETYRIKRTNGFFDVGEKALYFTKHEIAVRVVPEQLHMRTLTIVENCICLVFNSLFYLSNIRTKLHCAFLIHAIQMCVSADRQTQIWSRKNRLVRDKSRKSVVYRKYRLANMFIVKHYALNVNVTENI